MASRKVKFTKAHGKRIMYDPALKAEMNRLVEGVKSRAEADGGEYGAVVEGGGDRLRGAVWTKNNKAKKRTAQDGSLLRALGGGQ